MPDRRKDVLTLDEIDVIAEQYKEDLRRKQDREQLKHDHYESYAALKARTDYIDGFITQLRLWAGRTDSESEQLSRPARARDISLAVVNRGKK